MSKLKPITSFEDLKALPTNTKVYVINHGRYETYVIVGMIRFSTGLIVANYDSLKDLKFLWTDDLQTGFWTTEIDTKEFGEIMIQQTRDDAAKEIEGITAVYLKEK